MFDQFSSESVAAGLAQRCEVSLAFAIGRAEPIAFNIETFGTATKSQKYLQSFANDLLDLSLEGIIEDLKLRQPIYRQTASYGHFGRDGFEWERVE